MSIRTERVAEQLLSFIGAELLTLKDPRARLVTLTDVSLSRDLKRAHIFWTKIPGQVGQDLRGTNLPKERAEKGGLNFPDDQEISEVSLMLKNSSGYFKKRIAADLRLRSVPALVFKYDESLRRAARLDDLLKSSNLSDGKS